MIRGSNTGTSICERKHIWQDELNWIWRRIIFQWNIGSVAGPSLLFVHLLHWWNLRGLSCLWDERGNLRLCSWSEPQTCFIVSKFLYFFFFNGMNHTLIGNTRTSLNFVVAEKVILCNICSSVELMYGNSSNKSQS